MSSNTPTAPLENVAAAVSLLRAEPSGAALAGLAEALARVPDGGAHLFSRNATKVREMCHVHRGDLDGFLAHLNLEVLEEAIHPRHRSAPDPQEFHRAIGTYTDLLGTVNSGLIAYASFASISTESAREVLHGLLGTVSWYRRSGRKAPGSPAMATHLEALRDAELAAQKVRDQHAALRDEITAVVCRKPAEFAGYIIDGRL